MKASAMAWLLVAALLAGCSDENGSKTPVVTTGSIRGVVVTEAIVAIPGANLTLAGNQTAVTDLAGAFVFDNLTPGLYVIEAEAPTFLPRQATFEVHAGNVTDARLVLPVNTSALAFHQTFTFKGFVDAHGGSNAPELGECRCEFEVPLDGAWITIIAEASWTETVGSPAAPTEFSWAISSQGVSANGTGASPLLGRVEAGALPAGGSVATVRIEPASDWLFLSQSFDILVTVWYGEAAPVGFRGMGA